MVKYITVVKHVDFLTYLECIINFADKSFPTLLELYIFTESPFTESLNKIDSV